MTIARDAVAGVAPAIAVARALDARPVVVEPGGGLACIAMGKAAVAMMRALLDRPEAAALRAVVAAPACGEVAVSITDPAGEPWLAYTLPFVYSRQLGFILHQVDQALIDIDIASRRSKGVDR